MIHENSLLAYWTGQTELFDKRSAAVLGVLERQRRATARECMVALGFNDPNTTRPRLTTLVKRGVVEEVGNAQDPVTGKRVTVYAIKADPRGAQRLFQFEGAA